MRGVPGELIFLLIVGFFLLAQFLRRRPRRETATAVDAERVTEAIMAANDQSLTAPHSPTLLPNRVEGPRRAPAPVERSVPALVAPLGPTPHRYSRSALMGNRRAVQNAFVVAAILQPCRARRPHGTDQ